MRLSSSTSPAPTHIAVAGALFLAVQVASAGADYNYWKQNNGTLWHLGANWSLNHVPTASEEVWIYPGQSPGTSELTIAKLLGNAWAESIHVRDNEGLFGLTHDETTTLNGISHNGAQGELHVMDEIEVLASASTSFDTGEAHLIVTNLIVYAEHVIAEELDGADASLLIANSTVNITGESGSFVVKSGTVFSLQYGSIVQAAPGDPSFGFLVESLATMVLLADGTEMQIRDCTFWLDGVMLLDSTLRTDSLAGSGSIVLKGLLAIEGDMTSSFAGQISGTGTLRWDNPDVLTLSGLSKAMQGGLDVWDGTVKLMGNNQAGGGSVRMNGGALAAGAPVTLTNPVVLQQGGGTFDTSQGPLAAGGLFSGVGALTKTGALAMALSAANTYSGGTSVSGGILMANNASGSATGTGPIAVTLGGTLGGTGAVSGSVVVENGGSVAPGIYETLTPIESLATGAITFKGGSKLDVGIAGAGAPNIDRVLASGPVVIEPDATIKLTLLNGYVPPEGTEFTIVTSGSCTGTFGTIVADNASMWTILNTGTAIVARYESPVCNGDVTGDGAVDGSDLADLLASWGRCASCEADITGDGMVDGADLAALLAAWGPCD